MSKNICVFAEHYQGKFRKVTFELLSKGRELADTIGGELYSIIIGKSVSSLTSNLENYGVDKVFIVEDDRLEFYSTEVYVKIISGLLKENQSSVFLCGATSIGKDFAPRLAVRLNTGFLSECISLEIDNDGKITAIRNMYAGKVLAKVSSLSSQLQIVTVRPNVMPIKFKDGQKIKEIVKFPVELNESDFRCKVVEIKSATTGKIELTEANTIVSGGRGMKGPENFKILEDLANVIGNAAVGASRAAVDDGWIDHSQQVGQTGKIVSPSLYIACGISGAIQHAVGISSSKVIVAINKDPEAPIFKLADYGIVGDLFKIVPLLTDEIKKMKG